MKRLIPILCLCVVSASAAGQWQRNFADNPSFEWDHNRDGMPDGWTGSAFRSPAKFAWDRGVSHSGGASVRISDSANPKAREWNQRSGRWILTARRKVVARGPYALGLWIKTEGATGAATACIAWWKGSQWLAESYTQRIRGTTEWRYVSVRAKAPAGADAAQVYLCLSDSRGTVWFDDVVFVEGDDLPRLLQPVDISRACNMGLRDEAAGDGKGGWTDQGDNDMRDLPTGDLVFRGVPFHVIPPGKNDGRSCVVLRGRATQHCPLSVTVPLGRKCRTIYFLHSAAWASDGRRVGRYEVVYEDGSAAKLPLTSGRQLTDWWTTSETKEAAVAWEGSNPARETVGLHVYPAANPKPDKTIKEVRAVSAGGDPVLMLVAITTSDGPPVLTDRPIRYEFTDKAGWYPFNFPLDDTNRDRIDLTGFLDPPAGKHGFLSVRDDGHFYFADGTRGRFFGTNICGPWAFPTKGRAPVIAARLAKYGVNLLRIHAVDGTWGKLIDYSRGDSRHLAPDALDRLDFFFAELKKRGIYVYFDCLDYRRFLPGDGVRDAAKFQHGWRNSIKGATIFNDRLIELQEEFATKFFTHANPYTGLRYVDDPTVAVVEITNENSVFYFQNTALTLPTYVEELRRRWNRWLLETYGGREKLAKVWTSAEGKCALLAGEDPAKGTVHLPMRYLYQDPDGVDFVGHRSPARVSSMVRFFFGLQRRYYGRMRSHLRKIGVKVPITGTNQTFCPAGNSADACNDFMSRNNYWQHPNVRAKPFVTFRNVACVSSDIPRVSNPITEVASSTVVGKPMIVPEFNFPWPNEYRAECLPLMAAYACLQDWDGLLFFAYNPERRSLEHFGSQSDPVRWGAYPAAAVMFHRRDVAAARHTVHVCASEADVFAAGPSHRRRRSSPFRLLPYVSKVRNCYFPSVYKGSADLVVVSDRSRAPSHAAAGRAVVAPRGSWDDRAFWRVAAKVPTGPRASATMKKIVSDTGQLVLDSDKGGFTINTPRTKAAVGFLAKAGAIKLGDVGVECRTPFAAILVTSLDARPIGASRRVLLTAVARAENTGQAFYRKRSAIPERGRPPVLVEPVRCTLTVPVPGRASAYRLDETGKRRKEHPATFDGKAVRLRTDQAGSPWIEIVVETADG